MLTKLTLAVNTAGSVIVTVVVAVHKFKSVTVIVYVPAHNAVAKPVVGLITGEPGPEIEVYEYIGVPPIALA